MADIGGQDVNDVVDALLVLVRAHQRAADVRIPNPEARASREPREQRFFSADAGRRRTTDRRSGAWVA